MEVIGIKMEKLRIVTTSWDDGHPLDMELMKLLKKYNLKGTFYVPISNPEQEVMSEKDLRILSTDFEIGAHTLSHQDLTKIQLRDAKEEILEGKKQLEAILGKEVKMFCYPKGHYNRQIINLVKETGFIGARTVEQYRISPPKNPFAMWTTIHVHPQSYRKYFGHISRNKNLVALTYLRYFGCLKPNFVGTSKYFFDHVYKHGGVFHLWGHSWEIERFGLWEELEEVFEYISNKKNVIYVSNGDLINRFL